MVGFFLKNSIFQEIIVWWGTRVGTYKNQCLVHQ